MTITPARLAEIIRDVRRHPQLSRETVLIMIVAEIAEAIREIEPGYDTQLFLEACYSGS